MSPAIGTHTDIDATAGVNADADADANPRAEFVHLRVHSEFSIADGMIKVRDLASSVHALGMPAVALTDRSNLFGLVKFYRQAILRIYWDKEKQPSVEVPLGENPVYQSAIGDIALDQLDRAQHAG